MKTLKIFAVITIVVLSFNSVVSQTLLIDNFNYPVRDSIDDMGGWILGGVNSPYNIKIKSPGLNYTSYPGSGIGNAVSILNHDNGDVVKKGIQQISSGNIYLSCLMRVDSLSSNSTQAFNLCFDPHGGTTSHVTKLFLKRLTNTTFNIGINKSAVPVFCPLTFSVNTTYLVIIKHSFVPGANNDSAKVFVYTSGMPVSEPTTPIAFTVAGSDPVNIGEVIISNCYASSGLQGSSVRYDGIKVGTTWNNTLYGTMSFNLTLHGLFEGFYNPATDKMIRDTAKVILRYNFSPYLRVDSAKSLLDSLGKGNFIFSSINNNAPYYITVKHRNSIETWSNGTNWFSNNSLTYNFLMNSAQAYGYNLKQKGNGRFCFYGGDVNQDGVVDLTDVVSITNSANIFQTGYVTSDVTGDNYVDLTDLTLAFNNANDFVAVIRP